jgi:hypothetical protein
MNLRLLTGTTICFCFVALLYAQWFAKKKTKILFPTPFPHKGCFGTFPSELLKFVAIWMPKWLSGIEMKGKLVKNWPKFGGMEWKSENGEGKHRRKIRIRPTKTTTVTMMK